jgi:hypothetical protein
VCISIAQRMVFGRWNFQAVGKERVTNATTASCLARYFSSPPQAQVTLSLCSSQPITHPPLATSPHPPGPSVSYANTSTGHKPCTAQYLLSGSWHWHFCLSDVSLTGATGRGEWIQYSIETYTGNGQFPCKTSCCRSLQNVGLNLHYNITQQSIASTAPFVGAAVTSIFKH